ncbi:MAG TPA: folate-binding protein [Alphaproteobacteria bacterium]|nr:folate-binding protein [Alphaproteobacteria bacterium]
MPAQATVLRDVDRGIVAVSGEEARSFLQGLLSNDVMRVSPERVVYAALLTPQGRYLHDFFIAAGPDETLWLDCEGERRQDLIRRLTVYRLRAKVRIADVSEGLVVLRLFGADALERLGLPAEPGAARMLVGGIVYVDPRSMRLGARAILPAAAADLSAELGFAPGRPEQYDRLRLALGVPDGSRDLEVEKALPMESRLDPLNAIDWRKGCYVGQELTARMKHRALVKRSLFPVRIEGPAPEPGTPILLDGEEAGVMRSSREEYGLALLRLEKVEQAKGRPLAAGAARIRPCL